MSRNSVAVGVEDLSKVYRLGVKEQTSEHIAEMMWGFLRSPVQNFRKYRSLYNFDDIDLDAAEQSEDILWALKGVSFTVNQGDVVGIVGGNGALINRKRYCFQPCLSGFVM